MLDTINGIPLHPLVVHAVVVLLPIATLGTLAIAIKPAWRLKYGHLVVAAAAIATVLCPVATSSGESLEEAVGAPGHDHAELGEMLVWFALVLLVLSLALVWLERRRAASGDPGEHKTLINVIAAAAVVAALASSVQVYLVGDSGAKSAWGDAGSSSAEED